MKPYVSLDIETTGLKSKSEILQVAMIYDDLQSPVKDLKKINIKVYHETFSYAEPFALAMNANLIKEMSVGYEKLGGEWHHVENVGISMLRFLNQVIKRDEKVVFAGKNVAAFDIPMLKRFFHNHASERDRNDFINKTHYKTLDVGSMYFDVFKENVSLSKINELTGRKEVSHDALDDAMDVVYAIRHKLGIKTEE